MLNQPVIFEDPASNLEAEVVITDVAQDTCLRTYELTYNNSDDWPNLATHTFTEQADMPRVRTGNIALDAAYAWSIDEAEQLERDAITNEAYNDNQPMDCTADGTGCYITGANWSYVWTRDTAYAAALGLTSLDPLRMRNSLNFKVSDRRAGWYDDVPDLQVLQDTGTGGSYPISTDRTSWAVGARAVSPWLPDSYKAAFDELTYEALKNTIEQDRTVAYNTDHGLYTGETSFLDWRWQNYPSWIDQNMNKIAESMSLSTNVTHWTAINDVAELAQAAGDTAEAAKYRGWADELATAIDESFWLEDRGQYSSVITGELDPAPVDRFDALATALVVLSGIAPADRAAQAVANYPDTPFGASTIWPNQDPGHYYEYGSYHNDSIWPFVVAFMHKAAIQVGNDTSATRQFDGLVRMPLIYGSNYENYNINDGGGTNTRLNSKRQTWSVAGLLGAFQEDMFGIRATDDGLTVTPFVTAQLRDKYFADADEIHFENLTYKDSTVDVTITLPNDPATEGVYEVTGLAVNGSPVATDAALTTAELGNSSSIEVTLGQAQPSVSAAAVKTMDGGEAQYAPNYTHDIYIDADYDTGEVTLGFHQNGQIVDGMSMDVLRDGEVIAEGIAANVNEYVDTTAEADRVSHCYSTRLRYNSSGNTSQPAAPKCVWGEGYNRIRNISSADFDHNAGEKRESFDRDIIGGWGQGVTDVATTPTVSIDQSGRYLAAYEYFLGSSSINSGLTAGLKLLDVVDVTDGASDVIATKPVIMASAADWGTVNESTFVAVNLTAGHDYQFRLRNDRAAVNMSYFEANTLYSHLGTEPSGYVDLIEFKLLDKEYHATLTAGTVSIDGTAQVGAELTAVTDDWPSDVDVAFQWLADGDEIDGATGATFTPGAAEFGKAITVRADATNIPAGKYGEQIASSTSDPTVTVIAGSWTANEVTISGDAVVGGQLTAHGGDVPDGFGWAFQWLADGVEIEDATGYILDVDASLLGAEISVRITWTRTPAYGGGTVSATSDPTAAVVEGTWAGNEVTISGDAVIGGRLTADGGDAPEGTNWAFQWLADGNEIEDATGYWIDVPASLNGQRISVRITWTLSAENGGAVVVGTSDETDPVAGVWAGNEVTISGDAQTGERLTAHGGDVPEGTDWAFQWLADGVEIEDATGYYIDLDPTLIGKKISVRITWTLSAEFGPAVVTSTSAETDEVLPVEFVPGSVTVSGAVTVGGVLTANPVGWQSGVELSYQWYADGAPITGATDGTFTLTSELAGAEITVAVTGTPTDAQFGDQEAVTNPPSGDGIDGQVVTPTWSAGTADVSGTARVGEVLTADSEDWPAHVTTLSYQWLADGAPIEAATEETVTLTATQIGKVIQVRVSGTSSQPDQYGSAVVSVTSDPTAAVSALPIVEGSVGIAGSTVAGSLLFANADGWADDVSLAYRWMNAKGVLAEGQDSLLLTSDMIGTNVWVEVTATMSNPDFGGASVTVVSDAVGPIKARSLTAPKVVITGTAQVGQTLVVAPGVWAGSARLSYQWLANGTAIKGATGSTLTLDASLVGKKISVTVTGTAVDPTFAGASAVATSAATANVAKGVLPKVSVTVKRKAKVGKKLKAKVKVAKSAGAVTITYKWRVGKKVIKKAKKANLKVKKAWAGKKIRVQVTVTKAGYKKAKANAKTKKVKK